MPDIEKAIKGLQIERECVSRDCDRDCGKCDLVQDRDWLLSVYDDAIALLKEQPDVVLCKDCENWIPGYITDKDDFIPPKCGKYKQMVGHSAYDYCNLAKRTDR